MLAHSKLEPGTISQLTFPARLYIGLQQLKRTFVKSILVCARATFQRNCKYSKQRQHQRQLLEIHGSNLSTSIWLRPLRTAALPLPLSPDTRPAGPLHYDAFFSRRYCTLLCRSCQQQLVWEIGKRKLGNGRACRDRGRSDVLIRSSARTTGGRNSPTSITNSLVPVSH